MSEGFISSASACRFAISSTRTVPMKCRKTVAVSGQRGVALVLTLIMLAVITVVTVIFLATARRNRSSTTVRIDQTTAEFAAETAYQHATGKIIERILNDRNLLSFDFTVSHPLGYVINTDSVSGFYY